MLSELSVMFGLIIRIRIRIRIRNHCIQKIFFFHRFFRLLILNEDFISCVSCFLFVYLSIKIFVSLSLFLFFYFSGYCLLFVFLSLCITVVWRNCPCSTVFRLLSYICTLWLILLIYDVQYICAVGTLRSFKDLCE